VTLLKSLVFLELNSRCPSNLSSYGSIAKEMPISKRSCLYFIRYCRKQTGIETSEYLLQRTYASTSRLPRKFRVGYCVNTTSGTCFPKHLAIGFCSYNSRWHSFQSNVTQTVATSPPGPRINDCAGETSRDLPEAEVSLWER
jgi:hypothetical protein